MNLIIYSEDEDFGMELEKFSIKMGFTVILNSNNFATLAKYNSELPVIYLINSREHGFEIFDLKQSGNLIIFLSQDNHLFQNNIQNDIKYKIDSFNYIEDNNFSELEATLNYAKQRLTHNNLFVYSSKYKKISVPKNNIYMIEAASGKDRGLSAIYHEDGIYKIRVPLKNLEKSLGANFKRCHRKYIVNLDCVISFEIINGKKILHLAEPSGLSCPSSLPVKELKKWLCS